MTQDTKDPDVTNADISYLRVPDRAELPQDAQNLQAAAEEKNGFLPNVLAAWAIRPDHLVKWRAHLDALMQGESKLTIAQREMIAVAVSGINRCEYCATTHPAFLRRALIEEGRDPLLAHAIASNPYHAVYNEELSGVERAIIAFAIKVTTHSFEISPQDVELLRALGLDDETIFDVAEVAAMFNFTNRLANATGLKPNREYHAMGR